MRALLILYACLNAAVYSMLLPLWEGFDEPFHFGYVQELANGGGIPELGRSRLSKEVAASIELAPASHVVKQNLPHVTTYEDWFALPLQQRRSRLESIEAIPREARYETSELLNYEAQHAPLAYGLLAGPERLLSGFRLGLRVLALRLLAAVGGSLLLSMAVARLCGTLELNGAWTAAAVFCVLSSQMTWAAIAHVGNDWLALPPAVWSLVLCIDYAERPSPRGAALAALTTAAGLLAKGYCLAIVPLLPAAALWRRQTRHAVLAVGLMLAIAGPWYLRNVQRYGHISGMEESRSGIGVAQAVAGVSSVDWAW